jgi:phosphopantothenoylcysteine decarboxylase/phosphopantothenate--cysteine ligase
MNTRMWEHVQVQRNVQHIEQVLPYTILGPSSGPLGVGEGEGMGRMLEPEELIAHVARAVGTRPIWAGKRVVITAGPTREALDPVRYLGNRSSGKMAFALAREAFVRGADVTLVSGPSAVPVPVGVAIVRVESAVDMLAAVTPCVPDADLLIFAAAVGDYRASEALTQKRKRTGQESWSPELVPNPDIAAETRTLGGRALRFGFALETADLETEARRKLAVKDLDWIMANRPVSGRSGFEADTNEGVLLSRWNPDHSIPVPPAPKAVVAAQLLDAVERRWTETP